MEGVRGEEEGKTGGGRKGRRKKEEEEEQEGVRRLGTWAFEALGFGALGPVGI